MLDIGNVSLDAGRRKMLVEQQHIEQYAELFCHRRDIYAVQKRDGSYFLVRQPITVDLLRQHLGGVVTCGWSALGSDNTVRWVALDADEEGGLETLQQTWEKLDSLNLAVYLESSRRGGHRTLLLPSTTPARLIDLGHVDGLWLRLAHAAVERVGHHHGLGGLILTDENGQDERLLGRMLLADSTSAETADTLSRLAALPAFHVASLTPLFTR